MISIDIKNIKNFMSNLLVKDTYDTLLISEISIVTGNTYTISGAVNTSFYSQEELSRFNGDRYAPWKNFRGLCYDIIKGSKTPDFLKIIFVLPGSMVLDIIAQNNLDFSPDDIQALFINLKYQDDRLTCVTGVAMSTFTMDKSLEKAFDRFVSTLFE